MQGLFIMSVPDVTCLIQGNNLARRIKGSSFGLRLFIRVSVLISELASSVRAFLECVYFSHLSFCNAWPIFPLMYDYLHTISYTPDSTI